MVERKRVEKVIAYTRVSTEEQVANGVSLDAQAAAIRAYCTMRNLALEDVVTDAGISAGKPLASREGGRRVLDHVRDGGVVAVIAYKLDRLFRDCADCLAVVRDWDKRGVALHLVDLGGQTVDTSTAMGRFFLTVMAGAAELERNLVGERTKAALGHLKGQGVRLGGAALGWARTAERDAEGRRVIVELDEEHTTIERIVALRREGRTLTDIAAILEEEGRPTKRGGQRWYPVTVSRVVRRAKAAESSMSASPAT
jgi:DNA invertase Pin-like site-specific DNA recombinase